MLVLIEKGRVLLLPRPPTGIWGGLLSLPEVAAGNDAEQEATRLGCRIVSQQALAAVSHTFTHFRLTITPLQCEVRSADLAAEPDARWLAAADLPQAALPAPIRKLLSAVFSA